MFCSVEILPPQTLSLLLWVSALGHRLPAKVKAANRTQQNSAARYQSPHLLIDFLKCAPMMESE